jgi:hypothetical protein
MQVALDESKQPADVNDEVRPQQRQPLWRHAVNLGVRWASKLIAVAIAVLIAGVIYQLIVRGRANRHIMAVATGISFPIAGFVGGAIHMVVTQAIGGELRKRTLLVNALIGGVIAGGVMAILAAIIAVILLNAV